MYTSFWKLFLISQTTVMTCKAVVPYLSQTTPRWTTLLGWNTLCMLHSGLCLLMPRIRPYQWLPWIREINFQLLSFYWECEAQIIIFFSQFFPIIFFSLLKLLSLWKKKSQFGVFVLTSDEFECENIHSSVILEPFWMCIAQPSLELMVGCAAVCCDQISVKRKYRGLETFTYRQAEMLWVLLTRRHTLCSSCNIDPALWHEWDPSAATRVSSGNYRATLQWQRTYSQPYPSSLLLYRPTTSVTWMRVPDPLLCYSLNCLRACSGHGIALTMFWSFADSNQKALDSTSPRSGKYWRLRTWRLPE